MRRRSDIWDSPVLLETKGHDEETMTQLFCPFCNAALSADQLQQTTSAKSICPRCGESIPGQLLPTSGSFAAPTQATVAAKAPWSNRRIGLTIFVGMLLMALGGLILALVTWEGRRKNDYRGQSVTVPPPSVQAPTEWAGLGYLPPEVDVAAGLQLAELSKDNLGKSLLAPPRAALLDSLLLSVETWTKLTARDIDHIVLGTEIKDKLPQLTVVIRTLEPVKVGERMKATPATDHRGKPLYHFKLAVGDGMLWSPEPRTLVLLLRLDALKTADLETIPLEPRKGAEAAPVALRKLFADGRIHKQSLAWAAGNLARPDVLKDWLAVAPWRLGDPLILTNMQAFAWSLVSQEDLALDCYFRGTNADSTRLLQKQLDAVRFPSAKSVKVAGPPSNGSGDDALWISLQIRGDSQMIRDVLERQSQ